MHERQLSFAIDVAVSCITLLFLAHRFPIRTQMSKLFAEDSLVHNCIRLILAQCLQHVSGESRSSNRLLARSLKYVFITFDVKSTCACPLCTLASCLVAGQHFRKSLEHVLLTSKVINTYSIRLLASNRSLLLSPLTYGWVLTRSLLAHISAAVCQWMSED